MPVYRCILLYPICRNEIEIHLDRASCIEYFGSFTKGNFNYISFFPGSHNDIIVFSSDDKEIAISTYDYHSISSRQDYIDNIVPNSRSVAHQTAIVNELKKNSVVFSGSSNLCLINVEKLANSLDLKKVTLRCFVPYYGSCVKSAQNKN